jgi:hypothetical protein
VRYAPKEIVSGQEGFLLMQKIKSKKRKNDMALEPRVQESSPKA